MRQETFKFSDDLTGTNEHVRRQEAIKTLVEGITHVNLFQKNTVIQQGYISSPTSRISAVLIALRYDDVSQSCPWNVLLTLRTANMRSHRGLVCLPGGKLEQGEDPVTGALREANEEVGLNKDDVDVLGIYDSTITTNDTSVYTVVSVIKSADIKLTKNPSEVEDMFWMPLVEFMNAENHRSEVIPTLPFIPLHYFDYSPPESHHIYTVWGLTARLLMVTANIVCKAVPEYIKPVGQNGFQDILLSGYISSKL